MISSQISPSPKRIWCSFMAFFGNAEQLKQIIHSTELAEMVLNYLASLSKEGNFKGILGQAHKAYLTDDIFTIEQVYETKCADDCVYEAHAKYADIHYIVSGEEFNHVLSIGDVTVSKEYDKEADYALYTSSHEPSRILMKASRVALYMPEDIHMTSVFFKQKSRVSKTVIKIPVTLL